LTDEATQHVRCEERGAAAFVTLDRPARRNALTRAMLERLTELFSSFGARADLRAVVLTGTGEAFCAGTDINDLVSLDEAGALETARRRTAA
jgi:enoyl-CoA hydratase/carnithine racemase